MRWLNLFLGYLCGALAVLMVYIGESGPAVFAAFASGMDLILAVWEDRNYQPLRGD